MTMYKEIFLDGVGAKETMYIAMPQIGGLTIVLQCTQYCVQLGYDISLFAR
jgi:hypothetical protein